MQSLRTEAGTGTGAGGGLPEGIVVQVGTHQGVGNAIVLIPEVVGPMAAATVAAVARRISPGQRNCSCCCRIEILEGALPRGHSRRSTDCGLIFGIAANFFAYWPTFALLINRYMIQRALAGKFCKNYEDSFFEFFLFEKQTNFKK